MKYVQWQYLEYEFSGNEKFSWITVNIVLQMKRFKSTSEGLVSNTLTYLKDLFC